MAKRKTNAKRKAPNVNHALRRALFEAPHIVERRLAGAAALLNVTQGKYAE